VSVVPRVARRTAAIATAAVLASALLAVAGCNLVPGLGSPLEGTRWRLTGWSLSSLDPNQFTITASFKDGKIGGSAAVNTYGGDYSAGPGDAFSTGAMSMTEMAGPEPAMRAEGAYLTLLGQAKKFKLEKNVLHLYDANGNESLVFGSAPQP
jgi:heat shock protein HslJ